MGLQKVAARCLQIVAEKDKSICLRDRPEHNKQGALLLRKVDEGNIDKEHKYGGNTNIPLWLPRNFWRNIFQCFSLLFTSALAIFGIGLQPLNCLAIKLISIKLWEVNNNKHDLKKHIEWTEQTTFVSSYLFQENGNLSLADCNWIDVQNLQVLFSSKQILYLAVNWNFWLKCWNSSGDLRRLENDGSTYSLLWEGTLNWGTNSGEGAITGLVKQNWR